MIIAVAPMASLANVALIVNVKNVAVAAKKEKNLKRNNPTIVGSFI